MARGTSVYGDEEELAVSHRCDGRAGMARRHESAVATGQVAGPSATQQQRARGQEGAPTPPVAQLRLPVPGHDSQFPVVRKDGAGDAQGQLLGLCGVHDLAVHLETAHRIEPFHVEIGAVHGSQGPDTVGRGTDGLALSGHGNAHPAPAREPGFDDGDGLRRAIEHGERHLPDGHPAGRGQHAPRRRGDGNRILDGLGLQAAEG